MGNCLAGLSAGKAPNPLPKASSKKRNDEFVAAWDAQHQLAEQTRRKFAVAAKEAVANAKRSWKKEIHIADEHFSDLCAGHWFTVLNEHCNYDASMKDGTDTPVNPKRHLRTIDFILKGQAKLLVLDEEVRNLEQIFVGTDSLSKKLVRIQVTIPCLSFPLFGSARHLVGGSDGHRLTPTIPMSFEEYWTKKVLGYSKYGPTFVQSLNSFAISSHSSDKMEMKLTSGKRLSFPIHDKTSRIQGGEKIIVRGSMKLDNLQRQKFIFPRIGGQGKLLYESVDGYLESITSLEQQLELCLLVPYQDDLHKHSHPFGDAHDPPEKFYHHHNSYSRMFNLDPLSGADVIRIAGSQRSITLPAGTVMEHTEALILAGGALAGEVATVAEGAAVVGEGAAVAEEGAAGAGAVQGLCGGSVGAAGYFYGKYEGFKEGVTTKV